MTDATVLAFGMARSGTSFLGELFRRNPTVRYLYEPFRSLRLARDEFVRMPADAEAQEEVRLVAEVAAGRLDGLAAHDPGLLAWLAKHGHVDDPARRRTAIKEIKVNLHLGWIERALAGVPRYIHIVRDPRAVVASFARKPVGAGGDKPLLIEHWGWNRPPAEMRLAEEFAPFAAHLRSPDPIEFVSAAWVVMVGHAARDGASLPNQRFRRILYEDLARDPLREAAVLYDWLGWELTSEVTKWLEANTVGGNREARFSTARDSRAMIDAWKGQLDRSAIDVVQAICGPLMDELGYERA